MQSAVLLYPATRRLTVDRSSPPPLVDAHISCRFVPAGLNIVHSAEVVLSSIVAGGSKRGVGPSSWVPVLPAALTALPAVFTHRQCTRQQTGS